MNQISEEQRKSLLENFNRFASGRSLTAIYECEYLNQNEQDVLLYLGHCSSFKESGFVNFKVHRLETLAKKIRTSIVTVRRTVKSLIEKGYLRRIRRLDESGGELSSEYAMTTKIFVEFEERYLRRSIALIQDSQGKEAADNLQPPSQNESTPLSNCEEGTIKLEVPPSQNDSPIIPSLNSSQSDYSQSPLSGEEKTRVDESTTTKAGSLSLSKLVQFSREHFDAAFARDGARRGESLGFDFDEANLAVAEVVDKIGYDRAKEFAAYILRYKAYTNRKQIKVSETPRLLQRFLSGMEVAI